jgi:hypothetical protein
MAKIEESKNTTETETKAESTSEKASGDPSK